MNDPKETVDKLMDIYAELWGEPERKQYPMYSSDNNEYESHGHTPPLIRWTPSDMVIMRSDNADALCIIQQTILFEIWGEDHKCALEQLRHLIKAIQIMMNPSIAPEGLSVVGFLQTQANWYDGPSASKGAALSYPFTYRHRIKDFDQTKIVEKISTITNEDIEDTIE